MRVFCVRDFRCYLHFENVFGNESWIDTDRQLLPFIVLPGRKERLRNNSNDEDCDKWQLHVEFQLARLVLTNAFVYL